MSIASDCGACMVGNHTLHDRNHGIREGVIGGTYCDCSGDCAERARARGEELRALLTAAPEATDPTPGYRVSLDLTTGDIDVTAAQIPDPTPGEGLSEADDDWFRNQCWTCKGSGCNRCEAVRDRVERIVAARLAARAAEVEGLNADVESLTDDVTALRIESAQRAAKVADLRATVERVEALLRYGAHYQTAGLLAEEISAALGGEHA